MVTTIPSIRNSQPQPLICTPAMEVQTFTAYQSETKKKPTRTASANQPARESREFRSFSGAFIFNFKSSLISPAKKPQSA